MAKFAPGHNAEEYLLEQLKCSSCASLIKPPIYISPSHLPVCNVCWKGSEEKRNYPIERLAALMVYPCEIDGCKEFISLAEQKYHEAICIYNSLVDCQYLDCLWKGPVHSLVDHVSDVTIHPDCAIFDPKDCKPLSLEFSFPIKFDNKWDARRRVFIYNSDIRSVFRVTLSCCYDNELQFIVRHVGGNPLTDNLKCTLRLESKEESVIFDIKPLNYNDNQKWKFLPRVSHLKEEGFVECDGKNWKIVLKVEVQEKIKKEATLESVD